MLQPVVLTNHPKQGWLLIHRGFNQVVSISEEEAQGIEPCDAIIRSSSKGFVSASYEITELCNVECIHCYLSGLRTKSSMSLDDQFEIINQIELTGVVWLQISGGEPLSAPTFKKVYSYAWDKGFLITILTNGTLLHNAKLLKLFKERPPFRVSVSIYGSSKQTYEKITQRSGSWKLFREGVDAAKKAGLRLRMKVVEMTENSHELQDMLALADSGEECDHISELIPTLAGDQKPTSFQVSKQVQNTCWNGCDAGTGSFHVTADGRVCLCKINREPNVPLSRIDTLPELSTTILMSPEECRNCEIRSFCHICPPLHRLMTMLGNHRCTRRYP